MKLAILGSDEEILQLAAAARDAGHELVWLGDIRREEDAALGKLAPDQTVWKREWELLLAQGVVDGVIVGRGLAGAELRAEQLKRLVVESVPVLVVHPIFDSVLPYYEIDMTRRETGGIVQHFNPVMGGAAVAELSDWVRDGHPDVGAIQQVTCERYANGASRAVVLAHLAQDVELLAAVAGDIRRVSAIGPAALDSSFGSLQVQMTAANVPSVRWSVGSTSGGAMGLQLALVGEWGSVTLHQSDVGDGAVGWQLAMISSGNHTDVAEEDVDAARLAIDRFAAAIGTRRTEGEVTIEAPSPYPLHKGEDSSSTWAAATRDMEVVDAVELSLQKGRTIEVFQQQLTERLAFRGTMAALGCGLLLIAFCTVVAIAAIGGAEGLLGKRIAPAWPLAMLAVLAFFLLLQAVPLLVAKPKKRE
jgi:hypothetical protein